MTDHFKRFIKLLNEHNIKYIILGGQAVNYWGFIRYTGDLDIIVEPTKENAENLIFALLHFGYDVYDFQVENFTTPDTAVQLGTSPDRIDILSSTLGIDFEACFAKKVIVEIKAVEALTDIHCAQLLTYLRITGCKLGLLINFNVLRLADGGIRRVVNNL